MCVCGGDDVRDCPFSSTDQNGETRECDERRAEQLEQLQRDLRVVQAVVHLENIGRYAPALKERPRRHTR